MKVEVVGNDRAGFGVLVDDVLTTPRWHQSGPAEAYASAIRAGTRKPEFAIGGEGGTMFTNPNPEVFRLIAWRSALRLEQIGIQVSKGRKVSSMAKSYLGIKHRITIPELKNLITERLVELGYPEQDRAGNY